MIALFRITRLNLRSTTRLSRQYHTGTIGDDNIIRGDKTLDFPVVDLFSFFKKKFQTHGDKVALVRSNQFELVLNGVLCVVRPPFFYTISHYKYTYLYLLCTLTTIPMEALQCFVYIPVTICTMQHLTVTLATPQTVTLATPQAVTLATPQGVTLATPTNVN